MKIKTFILTFLLMMMSSPIVFGQNRAGEIPISNAEELNAAISAVTPGSSETIKVYLKRDVDVQQQIKINEGVKLYIDLNNFRLTSPSGVYIFKNLGELTIEDRSIYQEGIVESKGIANGSATVQGILNINGGRFNHNGTGGAIVYNYESGIANINGGTFVGGENTPAIINKGVMTIAGVDEDNRVVVMENGVEDKTITCFEGSVLDIKNAYIYGADIKQNVGATLNVGENVMYVKAAVGVMEGEDFVTNAIFGSLKDAAEVASNGTEGNVVKLLYNTTESDIVTITGAITIEGESKTVTSKAERAINVNVDNSVDNTKVVISNLNLATTNNTERAINVVGKSNVELNNVTAEGFKYTINVPNSGAGCTITTNGGKYSGYAAVNITTEATFTAKGTEFVGINNVPEHPSNNYAVIAVNATNPHKVNIDIDADSEITAIAENSNKQFILTSDCDESVIKIAATLNHVNGDIIAGDVEGNEVAFRSIYSDYLIEQGYAVSESEYDGMISVDGFAVATIGEQTYTSLENAYKEVVNGQTITLLGDDKTLQDASALNYPVVGDTEYATDFTITTKEGYEFNAKSGFKFIFNNGVNVTFKDADVNAVLNPNNSTVTLAGVNDIKTLMSSGTAKFYVAEGEQTIGTLMGELNVTGEPTLAINAVGNGGSLVMDGATLNGTLPDALNVTATGENNTINAAINKANFTVAEGATVKVNANMTELASLTVNGTMNAAANVGVNPAETTATTLINGTFEIAGTDKVASIYRNVTLNGTINVKEGATFKQSNTNYNFTFGNGATINVAEGSTFNGGNAKVAAETVVNLNFDGNASLKSAPTAGTVKLKMADKGQQFTTPEITQAELILETEDNCKIFYENENNAYIAKRILNEGDVAIIEGTGVGYATLQAAIDACVVGDNVITLLKNNTEAFVEIDQVEGKNIVIDGGETTRYDFVGTIYIHGNSRSTGDEKLTIKNIDFNNENLTADHDYISSNVANDGHKRYAHNVTIENCNFTAPDTEFDFVAMRFRQAYNIKVIGGEFTKLHSVMWATGVSNGLTFDGIEANCKNGISTDTSIDVTIKNSEINADVYAVRVNGSDDYNLTIEDSDFKAMIPVYVRNATGTHHDVIIAGESTMTETNTKNDYWCVIDAGKGYEDSGDIADVVANDCQVVVDLSGVSEDSDLNYEGVYGHYGVAQIGNQRFQSLEAAAAAAKSCDTIELLWKEGQDPILMRATFVGNKTVTITGTANVIWEDDNNETYDWFYVGRNGEGDAKVIFDDAHLKSESNSASSGFHVSGSKYGDDETNNGTIEIKNSNIELDYLINKNVMSLDNSTLTVKNGFSVGGRPAYDKDGYQDSESGEDATATMTLTNGSKVIVDNHNGMGLGYEAIGIMDIDTTSSFEARQDFLVTAKGTMNLAGTATIAKDKTLTNDGTINLTNTDAKLYTTTTGLSIKTDLEGYKANYYAEAGEEPAHYRLLPNDEFLFVVKGTDENGDPTSNGYTTFPQAIDNAANGDTVIINTNGPIYLGSNKSENIVGKTVTVKMGEGFESVKVDYYNRSLIVNNGAKVIFDGVELLPKNNNELNGREHGFVVNNGGTVEFVKGADITADYITVNEGGTININDSKVNVNGTFINNNVVNVEGTSDIYVVDAEYQDNKLERGNGNYYMSNVTMNNTLLRGARVTFTEGENNIGDSEFRGVFDINEDVTVVTGEEAFIKAVVASVTNVIKGELVVNSKNATTFNLLNVTENGKVTFNEGTTLNLFNSLTNAGEFTFSGVEATSENIILNNGSMFTVSEGSTFGATSTFKFDGNVTLNIDGIVSTVNSTLVDDAKVTLNMNVDGAKFTTPQIVGVTTNCEAEGYKIVYFKDAYQVVGNDFAPMDNVTIYASIDEEGNLGAVVKGYPTFAEALANVTGGQVIKIRNGAEGDDEQSVEIDYNKDIVFTITGEAPDYKLPTVTFQNTTVNIVNSNITIAELDARQNATINVKDSDVKTCGNGSTDGIAKSYFNGRIVINNSTVYAHQATTMGYIDIVNGGKLNVTWQTNIYGNGLITVVGENTTDPLNIVKSTLQTAAFNLTGQPYNDRDNTDLDRVGKPATVVVDGAVLIAGDVINNNGANYSYEVDSYGINIGTIEGKAALLDIKNGSSVEFAMNPTGNHSFKSPIIGANGTVNIDASTLVVKNRIANSTDICKLQNNGVVYVTGESDINASVEGAGWFYMNGVTMSAATELLGAKVRFASGTNYLVGSTIDNGYFQVGIGAYEGVDENVDTDNGVIVNVSQNANVGASGATYAGWIGTGFYDSDAKKAAAMTEGVKYVLNINNSIAEFGYFHVSNDGELNVNGNAANKVNYNGSSYTFYAGDFIINGTAKFEATDVLAPYTKVSCDNGTDNPGTLNIINTEYEAERHNGAVAGINFDVRKTGVVNVQGADTELYLNEYTSIAKDAKFNVKENANVTALGTITNNGTINVLAGTMTTGTAQIAAIDNKSTGAVTVAQGSTLKANTNINNSGTLTVNGTLVADAQLNTTGTVAVAGILKHSADNVQNTINVNYGSMTISGTMDVYNVVNGVSAFSVTKGGILDAVNFTNLGKVYVTEPNYVKVLNKVTGETTGCWFDMTDVTLTYPSTLKGANIKFNSNNSTTNTLYKADLTDSKVTVNSGAALTVSAGLDNNIEVASLTNNGTLTVGNYANVDVTNTVSNNATATVNGTLTAATLNNNSYCTLTVNGTLTATTELYNAANAKIEGVGNIGVDKNISKLTNNGSIISTADSQVGLTISANEIENNDVINVAKIVATIFNNNETTSIVNVNGAHLESGSFLNDGEVNVNGESTVWITNPVSGDGNFNMTNVNLTESNTRLHGAYIVFKGVENNARGLTETGLVFTGYNESGMGIEVDNCILNIFGKVTANRLGIATGTAKVVLKETTSQLTANNNLDIYPEDPAFVETDVEGYHVVEGADGNPDGVYTLKSNGAYVAMVKGKNFETIAGAIAFTRDETEVEITILRENIEENVIVEGKNITFVSAEGVDKVVVNGNLTVSSTVNFSAFNVTFADVNLKAGAEMNIVGEDATFTATQIATKGQNANIYVGEGSVVNAHIRVQHTGTYIDIDGTVNASSVDVSPNEINNYSINLGEHEATLVTATEGLNVETDYADHKVSYKNGMYQLVGKYVAKIGDERYVTLAGALDSVPSNGTIELLWEEGNDPIVMAGALSGKNARITQAEGIDEGMEVDWSAGRLYVGRMTEHNNGDATLTFENVTFTSCNDGGTGENGIYVSTRVKNTEHYRGTLVIENSNIEISSIYSQFNTTINNSEVTFKASTGMNISGVNESYSPTGQPTTSTLVINNSNVTANKVLVANLGVGRVLVDVNIEDNEFIPDTDAKSYVEVTSLDVLENGILSSSANIDGTITNAGLIRLCGGIYETQPQADWFVENYGAFQLPNFKWEVRVTGGTQVSEFTPGWHWYSTYIDNVALSDVQEQLQNSASEIKSQFAFTNNFGSSWSTGGLNTFSPAEMYMLNITKPCALEFSGNFVDYSNTDIEIQKNWNWIGYPVSETVNVKVALENLQPADGDVIKGQNGSAMYFMGAWMEENGEFNLVPGEGYMYKSNSDVATTFVYNTIINEDETQTRATTVKRWNANTTQYPGNMTMIAMVSMDGEVVNTNYEVAAFANGELRGSARPIYVEALDSYILLMTISGNDVEELTFKYYDVNYGTEYNLSNRINYSTDAIVGSIDEPYMLNLDILNIDEPAVSEISIYPNPTTTNVEINLNAKCDTVEVFNALGVKVAEYSNVDSIDALETAGIYVIRITNDGNVQNCRLVVK